MHPDDRRWKLVEVETFRTLRAPDGLDVRTLLLGTLVEVGNDIWRIAGKAENPHRRGETLVFVERVEDRRGPNPSSPNYGRRAPDRQ